MASALVRRRPCCLPESSTMTKRNEILARPKGLLRARGTPPRSSHASDHLSQPSSSSTNPRPKKRLFVDTAVVNENTRRAASCCDSRDSSDNNFHAPKRLRSRTPSDIEDGLFCKPKSDENEQILYWDYSRKHCRPNPERLSNWTTRSKIMDTSSIAGPGRPNPSEKTCDLEDWEDLKVLFAKAAEQYETKSPEESIPLLRGVIHECHRFLKHHYDPSLLYATQPPKDSSQTEMLFKKNLERAWLSGHPPLYPPISEKAKADQQTQAEKKVPEKTCKCKDLATAFHTILGSSLFCFGNLIEQNPTLVLEDEPRTPKPYWLAAIDAFEIGENLPIRTNSRGCLNAPQDWRMAMTWGRALVSLADEALDRQNEAGGSANMPPPSIYPFTPGPAVGFGVPREVSVFLASIPGMLPPPTGHVWPADSPVGTMESRRPLLTIRSTLATAKPDELLLLAQDQFCRGILHMPHPQRLRKQVLVNSMPAAFSFSPLLKPPPPLAEESAPSSATPVVSSASSSLPSTNSDPSSSSGSTLAVSQTSASTSTNPPESFSRPKELYRVAYEVLLVAEKLELPEERATWALWADSVFNQMRMEADMEEWRGSISSARGRCCLIVGSAKAEVVEAALEREEMDVLDSEVARDGRDFLSRAVGYLEKAIEVLDSHRMVSDDESFVIVSDADDIMVEDDDGNMFSPSSKVPPDVEEMEELKTYLVEALLSFANLTKDEKEREALYARAIIKGGDKFKLDENDDRMDESG